MTWKSILFTVSLAIAFIASVAPIVPAAYAATTCNIFNGCTGTSTAPAYGSVLVGGKNGEYEYAATSTFGGAGTGAVSSVFSRTGAVTAQSGDYATSLVPEGTNLYWTNARFDNRLSATTSLPNIITLGGLSLPASQLTGGSGGQVLAWSNRAPAWVATTSLTNGAGISTAFSGGQWTITNTGVTSNAGDWAGTWQTFSPSHFQTALTLPLPIANGGTGSSTAPVSQLIYGGATAYQSVATGTISAGSSAITVTAGRAAIGGPLSIDCAGASGSQNGCLSSTDWTTFNTKIGWGQATSTAANQIVYTNSVGKLVSVASSSLSLPNAALQNSTISGHALGTNIDNLSHDTTFTGTTYNGNGAVADWGLNLSHGNTFTALQQFNGGASSTGEISAATASSTNLIISSTGGTGTRCLHVAADGTVSAAASDCGSSAGLTSYDAWTHPAAGQSATTSTMLFYNNASSSEFTATSSVWLTGLTGGAGGLAIDTNGKLYSGATSTLLTISGSLSLATQVGSSRLPFANLTQLSANSVLANNTGATADGGSVSTSSLYVGTNGQVLARVNGGWIGVATTTLSTISGQLDLTTQVTGDLPFSNLTQGAANTVLVNQTSGTADFAALATSTFANGLYTGTAGQVLYRTSAGTWTGTATTTAVA